MSRPARFSYMGGDYEAASNNRERTLYQGWNYTRPRPEAEMLPMHDRLRIIAYIRKSVRNNPVMAALVYRHALVVGSPTIHAIGPDGGFNNAKERALEKQLRHITYGTRQGWHHLNKLISGEVMVAGEVFAVEVEDKVQLIPSELCGAPSIPVANEYDGIGYNPDTGEPSYYRFGVRKVQSPGQVYTTLSFEEKDGARLVPAEFVHHIGWSGEVRIECRRPSPPLACVLDRVQNLDDIVKASVTTFKNQAALSFFRTKNFDPALFAEASSLADATSANAGTILEQVVARSPAPEEGIANGSIWTGEVGEDVKLLEPMLKAQNYNDFCLSLMDQIFAPVGMTAEEVLIGYRNSNYSSARADKGRIKEVIRDIRKEREAFTDAIIERQTGIAVDSGELNAVSDGIADVVYQWPVMDEIDQTKTGAAQTNALANGSKSLQMVCAENGNYADQVMAQVVREAQYKAQLVKAYAEHGNPTADRITTQKVTQAEILAFMPNATAASESLKAISAADAATVNAEANATRANSTTS
jgi:capsid protein